VRVRNPFLLIPLLTALLLVCPARNAEAQAGGAKDPKRAVQAAEPEPIEEIQEVTAVQAPAHPTLPDLIGRFHSAMVHFPIAWMVLLAAVELLALRAGGAAWDRAGMLLTVAAAASFVPAAVTGFLRAPALGTDPEFLGLMTLHRNLNLAAGSACLAALALRISWRKDFRGGRRWLCFLLVALSTFLVLLAGHQGGKMVFGKNFLPF